MSNLAHLEMFFDQDVRLGKKGVELPKDLQEFYGSDFILPPSRDDRAVANINFVGLWDGIVNIPEDPGGKAINGGCIGDIAFMAILRATHDAVFIGSETLASEPHHLWTQGFIFPQWNDVLSEWRVSKGMSRNPLNVIVTRSGKVKDKNNPSLSIRLPSDYPVFHDADIETVVATTEKGQKELRNGGFEKEAPGVTLLPLPEENFEEMLLIALKTSYDVSYALCEGGPTVNGAFHYQGLISDDFHTLAPGMAGRTKDSTRASLMMGYEFPPENIPRPDLISVRKQGSHLLLRARYKE